MNTCSTMDFDKTAQFFFPIQSHNTSNSSPQKEKQKSLQIICIDPFKKGSNNIKIKRTNSQIELPKLQLYTEIESPDNHIKQRSKLINDKIYTPNASRAERFIYTNINNSNETSPQKMSSQLSFNKQKQNTKSFLKSRTQQKIVTRIFGE